MELKLIYMAPALAASVVLIEPLWNWNLKAAGDIPASTVLIEPLWNWNSIRDSYLSYCEGINRTFMELKPIQAARVPYAHKSINRTFMELKQIKH